MSGVFNGQLKISVVLVIAGVGMFTGSALGSGATALSPKASAQASVDPAAAAQMRRAIVACANRNRKAAGLEPLRTAGVLTRAAQFHAGNMARHDFFNHTDHRGRTFDQRVAMFDPNNEFFARAENIAAGNVRISQICSGWMNSQGHRENILDPDTKWIGAGFATGGSYGRYFVQVFGNRN